MTKKKFVFAAGHPNRVPIFKVKNRLLCCLSFDFLVYMSLVLLLSTGMHKIVINSVASKHSLQC